MSIVSHLVGNSSNLPFLPLTLRRRSARDPAHSGLFLRPLGGGSRQTLALFLPVSSSTFEPLSGAGSSAVSGDK